MNTASVTFGASPSRFSARIIACLAATWLIWGSTYLAIRFALAGFPPFIQMSTRFLFGGVILAAWMRWGRATRWPSLKEWRNATVVGALMMGGGMGGTAFAEQTVGSGLVVAFIAVVPIMMAAGNLFWKIYPTRRELAGIAVGLAGVLMLTRGAGFGASLPGLMSVCFACSCWSAGSLLSRKTLPLAPGAMGFASEMLCGGAVLAVMAAVRGEWSGFIAHGIPSASSIAAWLYLVVFGSLLAFNAYMVLLAEAPASVASSYCFVNPVIAMLLGVEFGGEVVTGFEWGAAAIVLVGVVLVLRGGKR